MHIARPASPFRYLADVVLVISGRSARIANNAHRFLDHLLEINTSRVEADLDDRLESARKNFEQSLKTSLEASVESGRAMFKRVAEARLLGEAATDAERERLDAIEKELNAVAA